MPAIGPLFNVYSQKIPRTRKLIIYRSDTPCGARARDIDHLERPVAACAIGRASLVHTPSDWPAQMAARPTDDQQPARRDDSTNPPVHTQRARAHLNDTLCLPRPGVRPDERDRRDNSSRTRAPAIGARNWQCAYRDYLFGADAVVQVIPAPPPRTSARATSKGGRRARAHPSASTSDGR